MVQNWFPKCSKGIGSLYNPPFNVQHHPTGRLNLWPKVWSECWSPLKKVLKKLSSSEYLFSHEHDKIKTNGLCCAYCSTDYMLNAWRSPTARQDTCCKLSSTPWLFLLFWGQWIHAQLKSSISVPQTPLRSIDRQYSLTSTWLWHLCCMCDTSSSGC